jgi:hypothetical protein|tara:strand:- start:42 stop:239 length:198 start_codon:yes stop_codon:yes gene_type:complete
MRQKMINNILYDLTAEDLQQMEIDKIEEARIKVIEDAKAEKKASGKAKLIALGLTEEEVKETFGI